MQRQHQGCTPRTGSTPAWDPYLSPASPVGPIPGSSRRGFSCSRPGREIPNFQTAPVLSLLLPVRRYNTHPAWLVGVVLNLPPSVRPLFRISSCLLRRLAALPRPQPSVFRDLFSAPAEAEHSDGASYSAFLLLTQYNRDSDKGGGTIRLCGEAS